jgi:anti-anti-sigma factor
MGSTRAQPFRADVHARSDSCELRLEGEIDVATAPLVAEAAGRLEGSGGGPVAVDVGGVTFCDARGVAALLHLVRSLGDRGREVTIHRPHPRVVRVLHLCGAMPALRVEDGLPGSGSTGRFRPRR